MEKIITKFGREIILPTDEEDAAITAAAMFDPDCPIWSDEKWAKAKPYVLRGRPVAEITKKRVSIRLSPDTVTKFRATGKGWQTRIDKALGVWLATNDLEKMSEKSDDKKSA